MDTSQCVGKDEVSSSNLLSSSMKNPHRLRFVGVLVFSSYEPFWAVGYDLVTERPFFGYWAVPPAYFPKRQRLCGRSLGARGHICSWLWTFEHGPTDSIRS